MSKFKSKLIQFYTAPAFHFLMLGLVLFWLYSWLNPKVSENSSRTVVMADKEFERLRNEFKRQNHRFPNLKEDSLIKVSWAAEEILYQEAMQIGLDKNDEIVRRRMIQKMEFFIDAVIPIDSITEAEIKSYWNKHHLEFTHPAQVTFTHLFFNQEQNGSYTSTHAQELLRKIRTHSLTENEALKQSDPFIVEVSKEPMEYDQISRDFGQEFTEKLFTLPLNSWEGPIVSQYGNHLVKITKKEDEILFNYDEARPIILAKLKDAKIEKARDDFRSNLFNKYTIELRSLPARPIAPTEDLD